MRRARVVFTWRQVREAVWVVTEESPWWYRVVWWIRVMPMLLFFTVGVMLGYYEDEFDADDSHPYN